MNDDDHEIMERLKDETPENAIWERAGDKAKSFYLRYLDESFLRFRLDDVLGPENWQCDTIVGTNSVKTILEIHLPSGKVLTRSGISGLFIPGTSAKEDSNAVMGAETNSFKRACARFGIGSDVKGHHYHPQNEIPQRNETPRRSGGGGGGGGGGNRRDLGEPQRNAPPAQRSQGGGGRQEGARGYGPPKTGRALFAWLKQQIEPEWANVLDFVNNKSELENCPFDKIIKYDEQWTKWAHDLVIHEMNRAD